MAKTLSLPGPRPMTPHFGPKPEACSLQPHDAATEGIFAETRRFSGAVDQTAQSGARPARWGRRGSGSCGPLPTSRIIGHFARNTWYNPPNFTEGSREYETYLPLCAWIDHCGFCSGL
jgi:hypothetical protein